ncbi:potassium transporter TrkA [candidate division WOR-3 bacterium]|nr:potassium transporter TrkA [candidate division WOR-3 bacterium]
MKDKDGVTFREKFSYAFDNVMSKGPAALIGWLAILSLLVVLIFSVIVLLTHTAPENVGFIKLIWMSMLRTLDPGTMGADEGNVLFLLSMFGVTLGGIFIISTLIGILTTGLESRLDSMRKGRSKIIESNHTVILGWSEQVFTIIRELVIANENQKKSCIAILADKDKVEMEDEIKIKTGSKGKTKVVCRTGNPADLADLELMRLKTSKSIIVLSPDSENPDSEVIKTILAITNNPHRREEPYHVTALLRNPENVEIAKMVGKDEVELVLSGELIARMMAQTCLQSGLSIVYYELLDFGGDEIYFKDEPSLYGKKFSETLALYEDSSVIGLFPKGGTPLLNPPMDTVVGEGDQIIAISEDDDTVVLSGVEKHEIFENAIVEKHEDVKKPQRILLIGWNWRAPIIVRELDNYLASGSFIQVVYDIENNGVEERLSQLQLKNATYKISRNKTTDRRVLESLDIPTYNHVILLCYSDHLTPHEADSQTLITLLHIREISENTKNSFSVVSEMIDVRNRNLAEITKADDFIISDNLISLLLSQISENKYLSAVFEDLFDPEGSETYIKPVERYVKTGTTIDFYTVLKSASLKSEVAIGYRLKKFWNDPEKAYGIVVNPDKSEKITFSEGDKIIVMAED